MQRSKLMETLGFIGSLLFATTMPVLATDGISHGVSIYNGGTPNPPPSATWFASDPTGLYPGKPGYHLNMNGQYYFFGYSGINYPPSTTSPAIYNTGKADFAYVQLIYGVNSSYGFSGNPDLSFVIKTKGLPIKGGGMTVPDYYVSSSALAPTPTKSNAGFNAYLLKASTTDFVDAPATIPNVNQMSIIFCGYPLKPAGNPYTTPQQVPDVYVTQFYEKDQAEHVPSIVSGVDPEFVFSAATGGH